MSTVQNQPTIYGKQNIYPKQKSVCTTLKKQVRGNSKTTTPPKQQKDAGVSQAW